MLARPSPVVATNRTVLLPLLTGAVTVTVDQLVHAPVGPNPTFDWTTAPLTTRLAARLLDVPLAYPISRVAVPPEPAVIVNCAAAPEAFSVLQNPVPENPACSDSIAPSQVAGEFSASYRPSGGGVDGVGSVGVGLVGVDGVGEGC